MEDSPEELPSNLSITCWAKNKTKKNLKDFPDAGNIGVDHHRIVGVVNDEAGFCTFGLFDFFAKDVINFSFFAASGL